MSVTTKKIGNVEVPVPGFGAMGLSFGYSNKQSESEKKAVLSKLLELGMTVIDTADIYGPAANEELIGSWLKETGLREKVFLCTKFGFVWDRDTRKAVPATVDGRPEYVKQACEESLRRLGVDSIDMYYQHRVDQNTPIEETVRAMEELRQEGKIKYLGLSEPSAATIRKACKVAQIHAVQVEFSPWCLDILTNGIFETCKELGIAVVCFSPIGRGFLTGAIKSPDDFAEGDMRKLQPRFSKANFPSNLKLVEKIKSLADKKGCSASQLCLAWLAAQGDNVITIPGTTSIKNLEENWASTKIHLSAEEDAEIKKAIAEVPIAGDRYPEAMMKLVGR